MSSSRFGSSNSLRLTCRGGPSACRLPSLFWSTLLSAPLLAVSWAIVIRRAPHIRLALGLLQWAGVRARYDEGPEVWDEVFGHQDTQRWVRVVFRDGTALEGVVTGAGVSPAARQVYLRGLEDVANSLARLDAQGNVLEDLSAKGAEGVWIDIGGDVRVVEVYRP